MPSVYKASSVTLMDDIVTVDICGAAGPLVQPDNCFRDECLGAAEEKKNQETDFAPDEAEEILRNARGEAQKIRENALRETERLRAETLESARGQGYNEGFKKGVSDSEALKREAERIMSETYAKREAIMKGVEPQMINLIIKILNKLLGSSVKINPQIISKLIREGLSLAVDPEGAKVRVSPEDYDFVRENFGKITEYAGSNSVELVKDALLRPMDCVIETSYGNIDSSLDQQFDALKADLLYTLGSAEA